MALRALRIVAVASIIAFGLTARSVGATYAHADDSTAAALPATVDQAPLDPAGQPSTDPLPSDPAPTEPPPTTDPQPTDPPPTEPPPTTDPQPTDPPPTEPQPTDPPPVDDEAPTGVSVEKLPNETEPPDTTSAETPPGDTTSAETPPADTPPADPADAAEPPPISSEPSPTPSDSPSPSDPPISVSPEPPLPDPPDAEPIPPFPDAPAAEPVLPLPSAIPSSEADAPLAADQAPAETGGSHAAVRAAPRPLVAKRIGPADAPSTVVPAGQVRSLVTIGAAPGTTWPSDDLERMTAGLVTGLAVTNRAASVAVAIEFGRAGGGWAGALVFNVWLGRRMRERRLSQRQLAALSGVDHSTISRILRHDRLPLLGTATKLAKALKQVGGDDGESDAADYFERIPEETVFPARRVEMALRADELLDDEQVRQLMNDYLEARRNHQATALSGTLLWNGRTAAPARDAQNRSSPSRAGPRRAAPEPRR